MADINITPMVDVMLVLVVIFILTAPLLASSIRLELPQGASAVAAGGGGPALAVAVDAAGAVFIDGQPVEGPSLVRRFADAARNRPDAEVQLRADRAVPYGKVVAVMDAARQAGLYRIGFVADPVPAAANLPALPQAVPTTGPAQPAPNGPPAGTAPGTGGEAGRKPAFGPGDPVR